MAKVERVESVVDFVHRLEEDLEESKDYFYRGHGQSGYSPLPTILRNSGHRSHERELLYEITSESPSEFASDRLTFEKLVRAQHYFVPTRLLDVTTNPLMALFFACDAFLEEQKKNPDSKMSDPEVLVFAKDKNSSKFYSSDVVSCKSNLAQLTETERDAIRDAVLRNGQKKFSAVEVKRSLSERRRRTPDKYRNFIEHFNEDDTVRRLVQFVREEKPYFEPRIDPIDLMSIDAVYPKKSNARISAQAGAFLIFGLLPKFSDRTAYGISIDRISISRGSVQKLLVSLSRLGISKHTAFPELAYIGIGIADKYWDA